jgi:hypothetical protein
MKASGFAVVVTGRIATTPLSHRPLYGVRWLARLPRRKQSNRNIPKLEFEPNP